MFHRSFRFSSKVEGPALYASNGIGQFSCVRERTLSRWLPDDASQARKRIRRSCPAADRQRVGDRENVSTCVCVCVCVCVKEDMHM